MKSHEMKAGELIKVGKVVDRAQQLWRYDPQYLDEEKLKEYKLLRKKVHYLALLLDKMEEKGIII